MNGRRSMHVLPFFVLKWIFVDKSFNDDRANQCTQLSSSIRVRCEASHIEREGLTVLDYHYHVENCIHKRYTNMKCTKDTTLLVLVGTGQI